MTESIVVTGTSRGLGATIAEAILDQTDFKVVGVSRSRSDQVDAFNATYPNRYDHAQCDLSRPAKVRGLYQNELKPKGPIHGLVNNAAVAYDDLVTNADPDELQVLFNVNVIAPILLSKYSIRDMLLHRTRGSLVHISSVSTATGYKGLSMYGATKGAIEALSLSLAREWGERGIRSNCIAPGFMDTSMTSALDDSMKNRIYDRTGLGEPTRPESVAAAAVFLLSEAATSMTGEVIRIDAGTL